MSLLVLPVLCVSLLGTWWLARPGNPLVATAPVDGRSLHERPTPAGGGLAVVVAFLLGDLAFRLRLVDPVVGGGLLPTPDALAGLLLVAAVSWADDHRPLPAARRLLVQFGAGLLATAGGQVVLEVGWPGLGAVPLGILAVPLTVLGVVWAVNLFNFLDGMDGYAGAMGLIGFGGLGFLALRGGADDLALAGLVAAAACLGFLAFNWPPARIFLGDVGSAPLGYLAAVLGLWGMRVGAWPAAVPLLVFAPFWTDATVTLARRVLTGQRFWEPHRSHAYQRLARAGWGHRATTLAGAGWMLASLVLAWAYVALPEASRGRVLLVAALLAAVCLGFAHLRGGLSGGRKGGPTASQG